MVPGPPFSLHLPTLILADARTSVALICLTLPDGRGSLEIRTVPELTPPLNETIRQTHDSANNHRSVLNFSATADEEDMEQAKSVEGCIMTNELKETVYSNNHRANSVTVVG